MTPNPFRLRTDPSSLSCSEASVIYELPFGPGRAHLNSGGVLATIARDWQVSSTFSAYDGTPFTVTSSTHAPDGNLERERAERARHDLAVR